MTRKNSQNQLQQRLLMCTAFWCLLFATSFAQQSIQHTSDQTTQAASSQNSDTRKPSDLKPDSFRITIPKMAGPKVDGQNDSTNRRNATLIEPNLEVSIESGKVPMTPEKHRALAQQKL